MLFDLYCRVEWCTLLIFIPSMTKSSLVLASNSHQRKLLLEGLGVAFEVIPSTLDEKNLVQPPEIERTLFLAEKKATEVGVRLQNRFVLAADTIVYQGSKLLEKPETIQEAAEMLQLISDTKISVLTGVAFWSPNQPLKSRVVTVEVEMRALSLSEITAYVDTQPVLTWSAAFSPAYAAGAALVSRVNGSLTAFSHGLPIEVVVPWLVESGLW